MSGMSSSKSLVTLDALTSGYRGEERPRWEDYSTCIHCGLCLNHCPTYRLFGVEMDSPRGRVHQMILVDDGRIELADSFVRHIDLCLGCRACETACPSGVPYGRLVEAARAQIERNYRRPLLARLFRSLGLRHTLPYPRRLAALGRVLRFYQRSGVQRIVRGTGLLAWLGKLGEAEKLLPKLDDRFFFSELGRVFPHEGTRRARVGFIAGCIAQLAFAEMNRATVRVLQKNGCEVVVPAGQLCCGALHVHNGERDLARRLARVNLDVFLSQDVDAILTNAAGCAATLKEYEFLFSGDAALGKRAKRFEAKVRDVTEFLDELGLRAPERPLPLRVTYQDPCHLAHAQRIRLAPRELVRAIPGVELVEMKLADHCCGSAGIYNLTEPQVAQALLKEKMADARSTGAEMIVTANPGCILQLRAGVERFGTGQRVLHVVELLDEAYKQSEQRKT